MKKILIIVSFIILVSVGLLYFWPKTDVQVKPIENLPVNNNLTWQTFDDSAQNISWQYPNVLDASYISLAEWPPKISLSKAVFSCPETITVDTPANTITKKVVNSHTYCIETSSEGAAGSVYTTYTYSTQQTDNLVVAKFTLRYPQCYNYDDPAKTACEKEQNDFALNELIDKIITSIKSN